MVDIWIIEKLKEEEKIKDDRPVLRIPLEEEYVEPPKENEDEKVKEERGVWIIDPEEED